eukprot:GILJ01011982.1.p1 GENE.GILJ01011982.1~~GILJ01011982.1.p1  ORF type:complete len:502 (+),score=39.08 GILJ01011982.1:661-2166(+)
MPKSTRTGKRKRRNQTRVSNKRAQAQESRDVSGTVDAAGILGSETHQDESEDELTPPLRTSRRRSRVLSDSDHDETATPTSHRPRVHAGNNRSAYNEAQRSSTVHHHDDADRPNSTTTSTNSGDVEGVRSSSQSSTAGPTMALLIQALLRIEDRLTELCNDLKPTSESAQRSGPGEFPSKRSQLGDESLIEINQSTLDDLHVLIKEKAETWFPSVKFPAESLRMKMLMEILVDAAAGERRQHVQHDRFLRLFHKLDSGENGIKNRFCRLRSRIAISYRTEAKRVYGVTPEMIRAQHPRVQYLLHHYHFLRATSNFDHTKKTLGDSNAHCWGMITTEVHDPALKQLRTVARRDPTPSDEAFGAMVVKLMLEGQSLERYTGQAERLFKEMQKVMAAIVKKVQRSSKSDTADQRIPVLQSRSSTSTVTGRRSNSDPQRFNQMLQDIISSGRPGASRPLPDDFQPSDYDHESSDELDEQYSLFSDSDSEEDADAQRQDSMSLSVL